MSSQPSTDRERPSSPTVLTFVPYYLPGFKSGGPVRSISNLVAGLGEEVRFIVVTADRDAGDRTPYAHLSQGARHRIGGADVIYVDAAAARPRAMAALIRALRPDVLYLNSFFSRPFSINVVLLRRLRLIPWLPIVLAPRGEFSPGALQVKPRRKRAFLAACRALDLHRGVVWHASTALEAADIARRLPWLERDGSSCIVTAPIVASPRSALADARAGGAKRPKRADHLRVAFLSRISPKKNLLGALQILQGVRGSVELDIYGPIESEPYWRKCRAVIAALPANVRVAHRGAVPADDVPGVLAAHDLFFLPTLGENYGHVIREALAAGTPVLVSDQTPWRGLEAAQVGWDLPLDRPQAFRGVLETCIAMSPSELSRWSENAAAYARQPAADESALHANRRLFRAAAGDADATPAGASGMINAS